MWYNKDAKVKQINGEMLQINEKRLATADREPETDTMYVLLLLYFF